MSEPKTAFDFDAISSKAFPSSFIRLPPGHCTKVLRQKKTIAFSAQTIFDISITKLEIENRYSLRSEQQDLSKMKKSLDIPVIFLTNKPNSPHLLIEGEV